MFIGRIFIVIEQTVFDEKTMYNVLLSNTFIFCLVQSIVALKTYEE